MVVTAVGSTRFFQYPDIISNDQSVTLRRYKETMGVDNDDW